MVKKKKYPKIIPKYLKNKQGKSIAVYLDYDVYTSIFQEIDDLKQEAKELKKKSLAQKNKGLKS